MGFRLIASDFGAEGTRNDSVDDITWILRASDFGTNGIVEKIDDPHPRPHNVPPTK